MRKEQILKILEKEQVPFQISRYNPPESIENISISFQPDVKRRILVGAHYDSVPGSTGANDNASSVGILIQYACYQQKQKVQIPLDIVFFDKEECGQLGSKLWLEKHPDTNYIAMINLDICGVGDQIVIATNQFKDEDSSFLSNENRMKYHVSRVSSLPPSDDRSFSVKKISTISIAALPSNDVLILEKILLANKNMEERPKDTNMYITRTVHNGPEDNISVIDQNTLERVYNYLISGLSSYQPKVL